MSLFGKRRPPLEARLIKKYTAVLAAQGLGSSAREMAEQWLAQAIQESEAQGTAVVDADFYLKAAASRPEVAAKLDAKRRDGVTESDICWWWNLPDIERRMIELSDDAARIALYLFKRDQGLSAEEAGVEVRRFMPVWGDPTDTSRWQGDDRPLPQELHARCDDWINKQRFNPEGEEFKRRLTAFSSCNALIRAEIRDGRL